MSSAFSCWTVFSPLCCHTAKCAGRHASSNNAIRLTPKTRHTPPADGARSSVRWSTLLRPMEHAPLAWVIYTPVFGVLSGIGETTYCARTRKCMRVYK